MRRAEYPKRGARDSRRLLVIVALTALILFSSVLVIQRLNQPLRDQSSELSAAIVDHLSLTVPNPAFIEKATSLLDEAGYAVDYYPGERVTVEFYRNLPALGYSIIILRVHSSATWIGGSEFPVTLFTSEPYSATKYAYEQLTGQLKGVAYSVEEAERRQGYFGITPLFVTKSMGGNFQGSLVIMMGCEGLSNGQMARAFIEKGAEGYASWSDSVTASHTDLATTRLLEHILAEGGRSLGEAVDMTMSEVGPDPAYNSRLLYYEGS